MFSFLLAILLGVPNNPSVLSVPVAEAAPLATDAQWDWLHTLEQCESTGSTTATILDTNGKFSRGILQFQMSTWLRYEKDFGATTTNIYDADLQERVALSMLNAGGWRNWFNCANKIGPYPIKNAH